MGTLANSEEPAEMQHCGAFHKGQYCLLRLKQPSGRNVHHSLENSTCNPYSVDFFSSTFLKNSFRNTISVKLLRSRSGPDILSGLVWVQNCLQKLSADCTRG